jgi:hypothetical protein
MLEKALPARNLYAVHLPAGGGRRGPGDARVRRGADMPLIRSIRFLARKIEMFFLLRVLSLKDTPHRIALGIAIAIFVTWTPTMGLQMIITFALCCLLKANKLVGLPFVWLSNPFTVLPIYGPNLLVGQWILGHKIGDFSTLYEAMKLTGTWWSKITAWWSAIGPIFWELWVGSIVVGLILGIMTYFSMYQLIVIYRRKRQQRKLDRAVQAAGGAAPTRDGQQTTNCEEREKSTDGGQMP